ncbi:MAG: hypothetical protein V2A73_04065 [Pseudomonadota bacterium]
MRAHAITSLTAGGGLVVDDPAQGDSDGPRSCITCASCIRKNHAKPLVAANAAAVSKTMKPVLVSLFPAATFRSMKGVTLPKDDVLDLVQHQPDQVDLEDLIYQLYLREKLAAAEEDVAAGRVIAADEVRKQAAEWQQ